MQRDYNDYVDQQTRIMETQQCRDSEERFLPPPTPICSRNACENELGSAYYKIFNRPSTPTIPTLYCIPCGKRITEFNPSLSFSVVNHADPLRIAGKVPDED